MKTIRAREFTFIVDDDDHDELSAYQWKPAVDRKTPDLVYAIRHFGQHGFELMHRRIAGARKGEIVDHVNGNTLDNRRANLRTVSARHSTWNRRGYSRMTPFKGVRRVGATWYARASSTLVIEKCKSEVSAAIAYNIWATRERGEFARLNDVFSGNYELR